MKKKCYIYTRVSTETQTEGFSLEAQSERLHEYACFRDLEIVQEYCDAGRSGKSVKGRPAFQQMMEDVICQKDNISFVLVFKLSRFGRNAADVLRSMQLLSDYGVDLVSVDDAIDSSTQGGRLTLAILSAVAEIERENITDQFMAGKTQKILDGKWSGGAVPYGYRSENKELVLVPEKAGIVRKIYELYLQDGMAANSVVIYLNENGYVREDDGSGKRKKFTSDFVTHILDNPFYCGRLLYNRRTNKKGRDGKIIKKPEDQVITVQGVHEAIITEEEWEAVRKKRDSLSRKNKNTDNPERISLLSGLVKCPHCGSGLVMKKSKQVNKNRGGYYKTIYYYACRNYQKANGRTCSFRHTYNQDKLDSARFEIVQKVSGTQEFKDAVVCASEEKANVQKLEEQLQRLRKKLQQLEMKKKKMGTILDNLDIFDEDYDQRYEEMQITLNDIYDEIDEAEYKIQDVISQMEVLKQGVRAAQNIVLMLVNFGKIYERMSCREKREMYRMFIERIDVFPKEQSDGRILKSIAFKFSLSYGKEETVPKAGAEEHVRFLMDCSKSELTAAEAKATYAEIKKYIKDRFGENAHTLYIAKTKRKYGLDMGQNYNLAADPQKRVPKCPAEKEKMILEALKHFKMLDDSVQMLEREMA